MHQSKTPLYVALISACALAGISFLCAIVYHLGPAESAHDPTSLWLYSRRLLLLGCACLLPLFSRGAGVGSYGWHLTPRWCVITVCIGVCMGFGNRGGFTPLSLSALLLACFHAFATEIYFRAYLINTLQRYCGRLWLPLIVSSVLYGLFYLSVWATWAQPGVGKLLLAALFTTIGGIYGYCYIRSKSMLVVWLMHFLSVINYRLLFS